MEELEQEMTLAEIFGLLRKRWLMITAMTLTGLVAGVVYVMFLAPPPLFESKTTVFVNYRQSGDEVVTSSDLQTSQNLAATYGEIIKSLTVIEPVITNLNLDMEPEALLKKVKVSQVNETEIISINVTDENPTTAKRIANKIAEVFTEEITDIMNVQSTSILDKAKAPTMSLPENKAITVVIAGMLGVVISVGLVFVVEFLDRTFKTVDEVERVLDVPVLGVIPERSPKKKRK